ncbi:hypothetical protein OCK02_19755 [Rhizobium sp. TRM96647]|uniref:peroxidase family protein n=1 Tax=unclassified Rhizobium TaxID=2613769 RepID=UPI0021E71A27|nr:MULTISPECIES: peroxidase family protein [unclassified Rhizobium]MCV3738446.1 hypothetical protein [Rhizobium sp. TRM96647]MCV3760133.1 hypothetical protein [Rhizobium sp. TRM96650]
MDHGSKNFEVNAPRSRSYQGGFGRLFPDLAPWYPIGVPEHRLEEHFLKFASESMVEFPGQSPSVLAAEADPNVVEPFDSDIPSGYVYFGQFVDHDMTLDATPLSSAEVDPNRLHNFRTPRLDLDCLYGQGPAAQPHLYAHDAKGAFTGKFLVALFDPGTFAAAPNGFANVPRTLSDLPRNAENRALIGDPRNDENVIVAQFHLAFMLAHNRLFDRATRAMPGATVAERFEAARKTLRWLYQWIVWKDFVRRIADPLVHATALEERIQPDGRVLWEMGYKDDVYDWKQDPFMPVEFSVAAYRFGHSMVRNAYQTNSNTHVAGFRVFFPIFDDHGRSSLRGGMPFDLVRVLQWDWFLNFTTSGGPFPQRARKIDTKLANALLHLHEDPDAPGNPKKLLNVLAARNLVRGVRMKLPAGDDVARLFGLPPVALAQDEPKTLWYYVLKEAEAQGGGRLGPVGSIVVAATFAGILKGDPLSWLNQQPTWRPHRDPLLTGRKEDGTAIDFGEDPAEPAIDADNEMDGNSEWGLPAIVRLSRLPIDGTPFGDITVVPAALAAAG